MPKMSVPTLIFLEKQLNDLRTFVDKFQTLDPAHSWTWDEATGCYRSEVSETVRNKKVLKNHIKYEATKEHPAQVETYTEDVPIGYYTTTHFSGAVPMQKKREILDRVRQLQTAVVLAREEANRAEVQERKIAPSVFGYIFGSNGAALS